MSKKPAKVIEHTISVVLNEREFKHLCHALSACASEFQDEDVQKEYGVTDIEYIELAKKLGITIKE